MQSVIEGRQHYRQVRRGGADSSSNGRCRRAARREAARAALFLPLSFTLAGSAQDFWNDTLLEAREKAAGDSRMILLWIPSGRPADPLPLPPDSAVLRHIQDEFHLARAYSRDVKEILQSFRVQQIPALCLLDRMGGLVGSWQGRFPPDLWAQVDRAAQRILKAEEELIRTLDQCRIALERDDVAGALEGIQKVRDLARPGYPQLSEAEKLESEIMSRASRELRKVLAREGIAGDRDLRRDLQQLRERFPHPEITKWMDRELHRIRSRSIGGSIGKAEK